MKKWYVKPCLKTWDLQAAPILAGSMTLGGDDSGFGDGGDLGEWNTSGGSSFSETKTGYRSSDNVW